MDPYRLNLLWYDQVSGELSHHCWMFFQIPDNLPRIHLQYLCGFDDHQTVQDFGHDDERGKTNQLAALNPAEQRGTDRRQ